VLRRACFVAVHFEMAEGAAAAGVRPPNAADALSHCRAGLEVGGSTGTVVPVPVLWY
jgi:hypothetical protein